jgi:glyoxylase-like metal-dependent hydrolase (beta-lactamase superfamily II)
MQQSRLSRRQALIGGTAVTAAWTMGGLSFDVAQARAPMKKSQAPYFYRFRHGAMEATIASDGPLPLGEPSGAFLGASKDEIQSMLSSNFLPIDNVVLEQNALILNTGAKLVLFDTGMGAHQMFGKSTGRLLRSLGEAGIKPATIDAVVISHGHIDHIGGLVAANGRRLFPNAQVYISQADFDFWTDEKKLSGGLKVFVEHARKNLMPYRDRIVFIKDGQEFLPGIQAMLTPGHTVGHMIYMIVSDGKTMCSIGDLTHHPILLTERPRIEFAYDTDPKQAVATRVKVLEMLAAQKIPLASYHFPWPGIGHVTKQGEGFRYISSPMRMLFG